jgi:hypothetical protein
MIKRAQERIFISSLYIGSEESELVRNVPLQQHPLLINSDSGTEYSFEG